MSSDWIKNMEHSEKLLFNAEKNNILEHQVLSFL